jgi:NitT/TauT family transport system substrate-binding protein
MAKIFKKSITNSKGAQACAAHSRVNIFVSMLLVMALLLTSLPLLSGCSSSSSASNKEKTTVKIAYLPITHALPVLEAAEEVNADPDSDIEIELVKYGSWNELSDALNAGQVDGASILVELAMKSNEQGVGISAVALGHHDGNVIVADDSVQSASDLAGKTIAIPARQSSHNILINDELATAGLTTSDVEITELAPTEMPSALSSGQINAYCVAEPFGAKGVEISGGHVLATSEELWQDSLCCAFVLNDNFIDSNEDAAKSLVEAYKKAGNTLAESSDTTLDIAKEYLNSEDNVLTTSLEWIKFDNLDLNESTYDSLAQKVREYGLSENPPTYEQFVRQL